MTVSEKQIVELLLRLWRRGFPSRHEFYLMSFRERHAAKQMMEQGLLERVPGRGPDVYRVSSKIL